MKSEILEFLQKEADQDTEGNITMLLLDNTIRQDLRYVWQHGNEYTCVSVVGLCNRYFQYTLNEWEDDDTCVVLDSIVEVYPIEYISTKYVTNKQPQTYDLVKVFDICDFPEYIQDDIDALQFDSGYNVWWYDEKDNRYAYVKLSAYLLEHGVSNEDKYVLLFY
jgi:hypothetical protein